MQASRRTFFGIAALLFLGSAAVTVAWGRSMAAMGGMPMPGGWTLSMAWMPICGQSWPGSWLGAAASFIGMWVVMMAAMMLPSLMPMLWRYREAVGRDSEIGLDRLTIAVAGGYFFVWTVIGVVAFTLGATLAALEMALPALARGVPIATGLVVLIAGALQFTAWKARQLACCGEVPVCTCAIAMDAGTAWRYGLKLGLRCTICCAGLTAILLAVGVMDLRAMALVGTAIALERLSPGGRRMAQAAGVVIVGSGLLLLLQAAGLG